MDDTMLRDLAALRQHLAELEARAGLPRDHGPRPLDRPRTDTPPIGAPSAPSPGGAPPDRMARDTTSSPPAARGRSDASTGHPERA